MSDKEFVFTLDDDCYPATKAMLRVEEGSDDDEDGDTDNNLCSGSTSNTCDTGHGGDTGHVHGNPRSSHSHPHPHPRSTTYRAEVVEVNAIQEHIRNLLSPSTPHFFNTIYDPFQAGTDFVR